MKIQPEAPYLRNKLIQIIAQNGIGTPVSFKPFHRMSYYRNAFHINQEEFLNNEMIWERTVLLRTYPGLKDIELEYICPTIKRLLLSCN
jgi:dTDP-4-amino-4,6-dideoxygalactose transaminase